MKKWCDHIKIRTNPGFKSEWVLTNPNGDCIRVGLEEFYTNCPFCGTPRPKVTLDQILEEEFEKLCKDMGISGVHSPRETQHYIEKGIKTCINDSFWFLFASAVKKRMREDLQIGIAY